MCADPGSVGDVQVLKSYAYDLPPGSVVYADKAYNDHEIEDLLAEMEDIHLLPDTQEEFKAPVVGLEAVFTVLSSQAGGDGGESTDRGCFPNRFMPSALWDSS